MIAQLVALGVFSAAGAPGVSFGPVDVPPERTAVLARVQQNAASTAGIPNGAVVWEQPFDPADHAPYAFDFSALLHGGEKIADLLSVRLSATGASLGILIDIEEGYGPMIDDADGEKAQVWFKVATLEQDGVAFAQAGARVPVTMQILTTSAPPKVYERTAVLPVRQL